MTHKALNVFLWNTLYNVWQQLYLITIERFFMYHPMHVHYLLEVGHAGGLPGLGVGVTLGVVAQPLPRPGGGLDGHPVLGVRLQPRQLGLVCPVVEDPRLALQLGSDVSTGDLAVVDPVAGQDPVGLSWGLPLEEEGGGAHGEALQHVDGARQTLRGGEPESVLLGIVLNISEYSNIQDQIGVFGIWSFFMS